MKSYEELHEAYVALQRENQRLRQDAAHAKFLLTSLESLSRIEDGDDPFMGVFEAMNKVIPHRRAMVLAENGNGTLNCIVANPPSLTGLRFHVGPLLTKIMDGRVSSTFSNEGLVEWSSVPADILPPRQPTLYLPIGVRDRRGVLMLLRDVDEPGFDRSHVAVAKEFSVLASHAMATFQSRQMLKKSQMRAEIAEEASRSKNLFIANMSHELRTPLNAIIGFSEVMISEALGPLGVPRYADYISDIRSSGHHLLAIVNNLLLFAKIEAGQHRFEVEPIVISDEVQYALRLLQFEADNRRITLSFTQDRHGVSALADHQSLRQILLNVIGNAIKFSPRDSIVKITLGSCDETPRRICITVEDRGCGIPPETLAELGNPFVQAEDDVYSRQHQGTGLGLAICFGLAEAMGSEIVLDSKVSEGTTVTICIPEAPPDFEPDA